MTIAPNTKLGRYEIRSKLGAGGMGEVYLAEDTELHRKVALKVLPADVVTNKDRMRRFKQEATAAAALNHPNIAHIYEVGESAGTHFIAMEFVDGLTLRELIHGRQTDLAKLLRHLQHVADGLAKAHAGGIVHRDLKPDNIMVTRERHVKILDFGLAKLIEPQQTSPVTEGLSQLATAVMQPHSTPGAVVGTVGYMSPEQAQGKVNEIDHRSDGKFIAYTSDKSGSAAVYVQTFPISGSEWRISIELGAQPRWRSDGRELFYIGPDRQLMVVDIKPGPPFQVGVPKPLFKTLVPTITDFRNHYVGTADGQRFLVNSMTEQRGTTPIDVVKNWTTLLKR